jgi:hypothetical protein
MRYLKIFLVLLFLGIFPFGCCRNAIQYHEVIEKVDLQALNRKNVNTAPEIEGDTLILAVSIQSSRKIASTNFSFSSSSYATQKCRDESLGLLNKIDSIVVYSDKTFNGIDPQRPLNKLTYVRFDLSFLSNGTVKKSRYPELIDYLNLPYFTTSRFSIYLVKNPAETLNQKFKVVFYTSGNHKFESETPALNWK